MIGAQDENPQNQEGPINDNNQQNIIEQNPLDNYFVPQINQKIKEYPLFSFTFLITFGVNAFFLIYSLKNSHETRDYSFSLFPIIMKNQYYRIFGNYFYNFGIVQFCINMIYSYFVLILLELDIGSIYAFIIVILSIFYTSLLEFILMFSYKYISNSKEFDFIDNCGFSSIIFSLHTFYACIRDHSISIKVCGIPANHSDSMFYCILFYSFIVPHSVFLSNLCGIICGFFLFNGIGYLSIPSIEKVQLMDSIFSNRMLQIILGYIPINSDEKIKERIKLVYSFEIRFKKDMTRITNPQIQTFVEQEGNNDNNNQNNAP